MYCNMTPESQNRGTQTAMETSVARQWGTVCCDYMTKKFHRGAPGCNRVAPSHMMCSSEVVVTQCGRVMAVQLEVQLEAVDSLTGRFQGCLQSWSMYSENASSTPKESFVRMVADCWPCKHTNEAAPPEDHGGWNGQP
jgi:hypothetical protein